MRGVVTVEFRHDIGDSVKILSIRMVGQVDSMSKDINGLMYRVIYWNNGERYSQWLYDWEIE